MRGAVPTEEWAGQTCASLITVTKHGDLFALTASYPKVPGKKTHVTCNVDETLKEVG